MKRFTKRMVPRDPLEWIVLIMAVFLLIVFAGKFLTLLIIPAVGLLATRWSSETIRTSIPKKGAE